MNIREANMMLAAAAGSTSSTLSLAPPRDVLQQLESNEFIFGNKERDHHIINESDSSDNLEGASGAEDNDNEMEGGDQRPTKKKKRYHRHTAHQIQEMERIFKECPHPDEKQRQELSRQLKLSTRQIKFWFQNKRTQMKAHHERQDNGVLRSENEKLKAENYELRDAVRNVSCPSCGGPANIAEMSLEEQQLRIENVRLREEIDRITDMVTKYIGRKNNAAAAAAAAAAGTTSSNHSTSTMLVEQQQQNQRQTKQSRIGDYSLDMETAERRMNDDDMISVRGKQRRRRQQQQEEEEEEEEVGARKKDGGRRGGEDEEADEEEEEEEEMAESGPTVAEIASRALGLTEGEKAVVVELAVAAMEELVVVARSRRREKNEGENYDDDGGCEEAEVLWLAADGRRLGGGSGGDGGVEAEILDYPAYFGRFPRGIGATPPGLSSEASRHSGLVIMNSSSLVETFMDVIQYQEMFSSIVSRSRIVEVLSLGIAGTYDGAIQLMYAEFQLPTPLVPARENYFLRYCKHVDHFWVIVDVSIDTLRGNPPPSLLRCRRRPSGCIIEEMPNGYSKVTWVENVEVDTKAVHNLYQSFVSSGMAFGAHRWLSTLQRQCERIACVLANNVPTGDSSAVPNVEGRRSMLKLAERMVKSFNGGVGASTMQSWVSLVGNNSGGAEDVRVVIRKSADEPGQSPGIVLSAATSLWLPHSSTQIFQLLRNDRLRSEWDILSNNGVVEEVFYIAKGPNPGNSVSLLRVNPINSNHNNMLILQECCMDEVCSLVVYAPIDVTAMSAILKGGDPESVALLPSGFAIFPDCHTHISNFSRGALLTVAFQILVDHVPTARLSLGSVATVNKLISNTVCRIKSTLSYNNA